MDKLLNKSRKICLAVSGSIAAYKTADVVSQLTKLGHEVQCLMTESARWFVTPTVLETLSHRPVISELFGPGVSGTEHIRIARWADLIVFVPATANLLVKLALGLGDDLVTTVALATEAPWMIAPAMNTVMWNQPVIQSHIQSLKNRGVRFIEPASGLLACGEEGVGKMASPEQIVTEILEYFLTKDSNEDSTASLNKIQVKQDLMNLKVLITAGPTTSAIDAVRYMTNHSTGKMGAAMAEEALSRGAHVYYVLGVDKGVVRPRVPQGAETRFQLFEVHTAEEMAQAALTQLHGVDGVIAAAAVLDYRLENSSPQKLKRSSEPQSLSLVPSIDVLSTLREKARADQWFLGFAAETDQVMERGQEKLLKKRLDFVFANPVAKAGESLETGFGSPTNGGFLLSRTGEALKIKLQSKGSVAKQIWDALGKAQ